MDKKEEVILNVLIKECDSVGQGIRNLILSSEKIVGLGLAILAAGLTFGIKEKIDEILLFLPFAVFGVLLYGVHIFTEVTSLGGYKRYLEEKINILLEENLLLWELSLSQERHRAFGKMILNLVYSFFLGLSVFISLSLAWRSYTKSSFWSIALGIAFLAVSLIISLHKMNKAFDIVYQIARKSGQKTNKPERDLS